MVFYDQPPARRGDSRPLRPLDRRPASSGSSLLPLLVAAAIAVLLIAMLYPSDTGRVGDTNNAGPSVQTVTPSPIPSTSPQVPSPTPTGEPRPTQAPIR